MNLKPLCEANTPQWEEMRKGGIGASEAAAIVGQSKWSTPLEAFLRKKGRIPQIEQNDAMAMGHLLEPVIWTRFSQITGIEDVTRPVGLLKHQQHPWMLATPDAIICSPDEGTQVGESKTMNFRMAAELGEDSDSIPIEWLIQTQHQLAVTELEVARVAVLLDGRTLLNYRVERNQNLIDAIIEAEQEFWERVVNDDPPSPDFQHRSMGKLLKEMFSGVTEYRVVDLSEEATAKWQQAQELKRQVKELEERIDALQAVAKFEMGEAPIATFAGEAGRMLKRQHFPEAEIKASTRRAYVKTTEVKADMRLITQCRLQWQREVVESVLYSCGYSLVDETESGERYYGRDGSPDVRVADHDPVLDDPTFARMTHAIDLRLGDSDEVMRSKLKAVM